MRQPPASITLRIFAYELLVVWMFLGVYLLLFDQLDSYFAFHGPLAFWGFIAPVIISGVLLETSIEIDSFLTFVAVLVTSLYLHWFEISIEPIVVMLLVMIAAAYLYSLLSHNSDTAGGQLIQSHLAEVAVILIILMSVWWLTWGLDYVPRHTSW